MDGGQTSETRDGRADVKVFKSDYVPSSLPNSLHLHLYISSSLFPFCFFVPACLCHTGTKLYTVKWEDLRWEFYAKQVFSILRHPLTSARPLTDTAGEAVLFYSHHASVW